MIKDEEFKIKVIFNDEPIEFLNTENYLEIQSLEGWVEGIDFSYTFSEINSKEFLI